jgi:hypothetical protein
VPTDQCWQCQKYTPLDRLARLYLWPDDDEGQLFFGVYCRQCGDDIHALLMHLKAQTTIVWKAF